MRQQDFEYIAGHLKNSGSAPFTWVFYGDSITHGAAHTRGFRSFPEIFAERIRYEMRFFHDVVINTGISGETAVDLLNEAHYDWRVRRFKPDVVFILIGINDIVKLKNAEQYRANLQELVRRVRADGAVPVLQTYGTILQVPEDGNYMLRWEKLPEYNQIIRQTAADGSVIMIDHEKHWQENASDEKTLRSWLGEAIHPGGKGHLELAKEILRAFDIYDQGSACCDPVGTPWSLN